MSLSFSHIAASEGRINGGEDFFQKVRIYLLYLFILFIYLFIDFGVSKISLFKKKLILLEIILLKFRQWRHL